MIAPRTRLPRSGGVLLLGLAAALLLLPRLGSTDLWAPDEPRYALVARELRNLDQGPGQLVLPHLNGEVYTQKPPLYFWLAALASLADARVDEVSARLPSALSGIAAVCVTAVLGAQLLGPRSGLAGAWLLLTVFEFAHRARRVQLDVLLTLCELVAFAAFWQLERGTRRPRATLALLHGALGLAVLTKGPVGFLLPALAIGGFLAWERRLGELRRLVPPWALLLSLGPGLLWLASAATLAPVGFLDDAVGTNLLGRFFHGTSHARPFYYYVYHFPLLFLPWTLLWPLVVRTARSGVFVPGADPERARAWRFLLAWVGVGFAFFSLSAGKRGLYLLPLFPAAALLCADAATRALAAQRLGSRRGVTALAGAAAAATLVGVFARPLAGRFGLELSHATGLCVVAVCACAALAWHRAERAAQPQRLRAAVAVATVWGLELVLFAGFYPALDALKSPRPIARAAASITPPDGTIGLVGKPTLLAGLAYYGERRVVTLDEPGSVERFAARGGRSIVVPEKHRARVTRAVPAETRHRSRSGGRAILVLEVGASTPTEGARSGGGDGQVPRLLADALEPGA